MHSSSQWPPTMSQAPSAGSLSASPSTALSKLGARNRFASMNSYGSDWHRSMIFARSSQTRTLFTPAQESASAHSFRTTVRNSAKFVLQTGSRTRHLRSRRQPCSPQRLRRNEAEIMADSEFRISEVPDGLVVASGRVDKTVVTKAAGFVASQAAGVGMGRYTGARPTPTYKENAQLAYRLYRCLCRQDGNEIQNLKPAEKVI